jgi:rhodanese-related sulfurtransferase
MSRLSNRVTSQNLLLDWSNGDRSARPLLEIESSARLIDPHKPSLVYCHGGFRATTAASILLRESSNEIGILIDGVEGWSASGLPLEIPDAK